MMSDFSKRVAEYFEFYRNLSYECEIFDASRNVRIKGRTDGELHSHFGDEPHYIVYSIASELPHDILQSSVIRDGDFILTSNVSPESIHIQALEAGDND